MIFKRLQKAKNPHLCNQTLFISVSFIVAQKGDLLVKNGDKGLFLEHKVVAKESFFSVGRLYNVHPKFIASFNNLDMGKGLHFLQLAYLPQLVQPPPVFLLFLQLALWFLDWCR